MGKTRRRPHRVGGFSGRRRCRRRRIVYDESDVRRYAVTPASPDEPPPPRPYDPAILEARLAEIDKWQTDQRGRGRPRIGASGG